MACRSRSFHTTSSIADRRRPRHPNIKANEVSIAAADVKPYTKEEHVGLSKKYTPEQMTAIEAGEAAISPYDLETQGQIRTDPMRLNYLDDLATIRPTIDKPMKPPRTNIDPNWRYKTEDEISDDIANWLENVEGLPTDEPASAQRPTRLDFWKFYDNVRVTVGKEEAELAPRSSLSPVIPKLQPDGKRSRVEEEKEMTIKDIIKSRGHGSDVQVKTLVQHRVVNQTRLGKIQSQYYLAVAGNGNGMLGIAEGKSQEPADAERQAHLRAIAALKPIPRYENRTIYGEVEGKVGATELRLMSRPPG